MKIAIIGAGASGLAMAVTLLRAGYRDVTIFEKAHEVGGTWRENTYPGVACDVPSHLYRFSFAPKADWSREYASGAEIQDYMRTVADDFGVRECLRLNCEVRAITWLDDGWQIESRTGQEGRFDLVVMAMGVLHKPVLPDLSGRDSFVGTAFHSSNWPQDFDPAGQRVGIVGTGSTAVQILPAIVDRVAKVTLFQRSPQWVFPMENRLFSQEKKAAFASDPDKMARLYDYLAERLNRGLAAAVVGLNPQGLEEIGAECLRNLKDAVADPDLRARLTPDYQVGCKRLVVSGTFYPALQKPQAALITAGIERVEPEGIRTRDGCLHALDTIVWATGFDTFNFHRPIKVRGRDGLDLDDVWSGSSRALRSVSVPGFPNMFFIGGPNSPIGNFSFLLTAETQVGYIMGLIRMIKAARARFAEARPDVMERHCAEIDAAMPDTVWATGGCTSWYVDRMGKVASWPWSYERFEADMKAPRAEEFHFG